MRSTRETDHVRVVGGGCINTDEWGVESRGDSERASGSVPVPRTSARTKNRRVVDIVGLST